jgi:hypothetical protein
MGASFGVTVTYEEWLKGRRARRELSRKVGGGCIRREESSADKRLRKEFNGERGLPFTPTEEL